MNWLRERFEQNPKQPFINGLSYEQIYKKVLRLARKIASITKEEKRVALKAENSLEAAIFIFALLLLKKEIFLVNISLTQKEIVKQTEKLGIRVIFSSDKDYLAFEEIYKLQEEELSFDWEFEADEIAVIMNTSATSGEFKSVPICWRQIEAHVKASAKVLDVSGEDNWLIILPMFHISGLSILFRSLYNGTQVTILNKFNEAEVLSLISSNKVNMISMVPTMLKNMVEKIEASNLRVVLLGGEFIPDNLINKCLERRLPVYKTYGMTENISQITTFSILEFPQKINSVGKPLTGVQIKIGNKDKHGAGEIMIKSPMLMKGYLQREKIQNYFGTGDIGYLDGEGFLYVLNRRKDMIISGGENIYPKEIEDLLYKLPQVKECAVVGKEDEKWGQVPVLYIVTALKEEKLLDYLKLNLAKYKIPKSIFYRESLPKNASGKILRKLLQEGL